MPVVQTQILMREMMSNGLPISESNPLFVETVVGGAEISESNPMLAGILREISTSTVTIASGSSTTSAINFSKYAGGGIKKNDGNWTAADLAFYVAESLAETYVLLRDSAGTLVRLTNLASGSFSRPLPDELFGWPFFKPVSVNTASEVVVNQADARSLIVTLKS